MTGKDHVAGDIVIQVPPGGDTFTVNFGSNQVHTYTSWGASGPGTPAPATPAATQTYVWSKHSKMYHFPECSFSESINAANRQTGTPPAGLSLHKDCPR